MTDGEPETAVSVSLQKIKSIKSQHKLLLFNFFNFIKSQTCDSFVIHFDGHFAYLKTLDFFFNNKAGMRCKSINHVTIHLLMLFAGKVRTQLEGLGGWGKQFLYKY